MLFFFGLLDYGLLVFLCGLCGCEFVGVVIGEYLVVVKVVGVIEIEVWNEELFEFVIDCV